MNCPFTCTTGTTPNRVRMCPLGFATSWSCVTSRPTLQMEGLLGWWENRSREDSTVVGAALRSVRLEDHAALLNEAVDVLGPGNVRAAAEVNSVSSFTQRHPEMTDEQLEHGRTIEERLTLEGPDGADLRSALIAHAESGLAGMQRAS